MAGIRQKACSLLRPNVPYFMHSSSVIPHYPSITLSLSFGVFGLKSDDFAAGPEVLKEPAKFRIVS